MQEREYQEYRDLLKRAKRIRREGSSEAMLEAIRLYKRALVHQEGDTNAMNAVAEMKLKLGHVESARAMYYTLARYYRDNRFFLKAIATYVSKLDKLPKNSDVFEEPKMLLELADVYGRQGLKREQAKTLQRMVLTLRGLCGLYSVLAECLIQEAQAGPGPDPMQSIRDSTGKP